MLKEAIILAGGQGTRLRSVISDIPKPMAPIHNEPFLSYLLRQCARNGINHVILSVGFKYEVIQARYADHFLGIKITYAFEDEQLGTGGGIQYALSYCESNDIVILNGDSYFDINFSVFTELHLSNKSKFTMALKPMNNFDRYGSVVQENGIVQAFNEKEFCKSGLINTGIYCISKEDFLCIGFTRKFSFEQDFLSQFVNQWKFLAHVEDAFFIDIGIPEDYQSAQKSLPELFKETS